MITKLDFVGVPSTDAERSRAFYVETLGLKPDRAALRVLGRRDLLRDLGTGETGHGVRAAEERPSGPARRRHRRGTSRTRGEGVESKATPSTPASATWRFQRPRWQRPDAPPPLRGLRNEGRAARRRRVHPPPASGGQARARSRPDRSALRLRLLDRRPRKSGSLVDTGLHPAAGTPIRKRTAAKVASPRSSSIRRRRSPSRRRFETQLDARRTSTSTTSAAFPDRSPVVIQRTEWEAGRDPSAIERQLLHDQRLLGNRERADPRRRRSRSARRRFDRAAEHTGTARPGHQSVRAGDS